jgi:hypothetical protein
LGAIMGIFELVFLGLIAGGAAGILAGVCTEN